MSRRVEGGSRIPYWKRGVAAGGAALALAGAAACKPTDMVPGSNGDNQTGSAQNGRVVDLKPSATPSTPAKKDGIKAPDCSTGMPKNEAAPVAPGFHMTKDEAAKLAQKIAAQGDLWSIGKHQEIPSIKGADGNYQEYGTVDLGTLGPDVDVIFGMNFLGDIPTGAQVIYQPEGEVEMTRIVGIKRTDLNYAQICNPVQGDFFEVQKISEHGGDEVLDAMARLHAYTSAHTHTKVVYIGDLGLFEKQWGKNEKALLQRILWAQFPGMPELGLKGEESNFADKNR